MFMFIVYELQNVHQKSNTIILCLGGLNHYTYIIISETTVHIFCTFTLKLKKRL